MTMKATEGIIEKILSDARVRAGEITDKAELDRAMCEKQTNQWIEDYFATQRKALKREAEEVVERKLTLSKLDKRKIVLSTKQEIIGQILDKVLIKLQSLEKSEYLVLIKKLLEKNAETGDQIVFACDNKIGKKDLEKLDIVKDKKLTFCDKTGDFKGGIMLIGKVCDKDLSFKALIDEDKENIINKITVELFN